MVGIKTLSIVFAKKNWTRLFCSNDLWKSQIEKARKGEGGEVRGKGKNNIIKKVTKKKREQEEEEVEERAMNV